MTVWADVACRRRRTARRRARVRPDRAKRIGIIVACPAGACYPPRGVGREARKRRTWQAGGGGMDYLERFLYLQRTVGYGEERIVLDGRVEVITRPFRSQHEWILSGQSGYVCPVHGTVLHEPGPFVPAPGLVGQILDRCDAEIAENREFRYHTFVPAGGGLVREVILFFHGFNEKYWHKYLPWAWELVARTGKGVVLFPISFHMNRAPMAWSDRRLMHRVCEERKARYPAIIGSTLSNAAISTRLQACPQRFFWSGLQSYHDVRQLLAEFAAGGHPLIAPDATYDFFAYSIGCLLAQILLMTDPSGIFARSRLCLFCGGVVLNRMSPVSRFILDSECNVALYSYAVEHLESHLRTNERLRHLLGEAHPEGIRFRSMLNYNLLRREREAELRRLGPRLLAIALEGDLVIPAHEVRNTLQGANRDLPARVEILDFPYPYRHEDPFPAVESLRQPVDAAAAAMYRLAAEFLGDRTA